MLVITLPNRKQVGLGTYVEGWKELLKLDPDIRVNGFSDWSATAASILREIREGVHDRINRHIPGYGKGRRWDLEWQSEMIRLSRQLNSRVRNHNNIPAEYWRQLGQHSESCYTSKDGTQYHRLDDHCTLLWGPERED